MDSGLADGLCNCTVNAKESRPVSEHWLAKLSLASSCSLKLYRPLRTGPALAPHGARIICCTQRLPLIHLQPLQPQTPHQLPPVIRLTHSTSYSRYVEFADFGTWLVSRLLDDLNNSGASARILNLEARLPGRRPDLHPPYRLVLSTIIRTTSDAFLDCNVTFLHHSGGHGGPGVRIFLEFRP